MNPLVSSRPRRWIVIAIAALSLPWVLAVGIAWLRAGLGHPTDSASVGSPANGHLRGGRAFPPSGPGYVSYSYLGAALGRQYAHARVVDVVTAAFQARGEMEPGRRFILGETGWRTGGRIRPHRTHQNGLSVDIFVPLLDRAGRPADVPMAPWWLFGYRYDLDASGAHGDLRIDFDALARLLLELQAQARQRGLAIERVILAPEYVPLLLGSTEGRRLGTIEPVLSRKPVWVRHDEHVHVDFGPAP